MKRAGQGTYGAWRWEQLNQHSCSWRRMCNSTRILPLGKGCLGGKAQLSRDLGKRGLRNNLPASIEEKQAGCMENNSYAKPIILAVIFFVVFLLSKPLQRAAHFQEPGFSKQTSLWLPAGLGRIRGWDALPLLCQLNWSHVSRWFFDNLYKGLFLMVFLS